MTVEVSPLRTMISQAFCLLFLKLLFLFLFSLLSLSYFVVELFSKYLTHAYVYVSVFTTCVYEYPEARRAS